MADEDKNPKDDEELKPQDQEEEDSGQPKPDGEDPKPDEDLDEGSDDDQEEDSQDDDSEEELTPRQKKRLDQLKLDKVLERVRGHEPKSRGSSEDGLDYEELFDADEATIKKLKEDRDSVADKNFQRGLDLAKNTRFFTQLDIDTPRVETKYSQLNKESDDFNPALTATINRMYLAHVGYDPGDANKGVSESVVNPGIRYFEYVDGIFELASEMAGEKVTQSAKNISRQASNTGIRPDGSSAKGMDLSKAPQDMSDEELEAAIKASMPQK